MQNFGEMFGKHDYYVFCSHIPPLEGGFTPILSGRGIGFKILLKGTYGDECV